MKRKADGPSRKRRGGSVCIVIGVALLLAAFGLTGYNLYDQDRAGRAAMAAADQLMAALEAGDVADGGVGFDGVPAYVLNPHMEMPVKTVGSLDYVALLSIPSLGLDLPVLAEWSYAGLAVSPCRYAGSVYSNDMVIAAHNYQPHFGSLGSVAMGSTVQVQDMAGNVFTYQAEAFEIIGPTDVEGMVDSGWDLTLFTCTLDGRNRLALRCSLADSADLLL